MKFIKSGSPRRFAARDDAQNGKVLRYIQKHKNYSIADKSLDLLCMEATPLQKRNGSRSLKKVLTYCLPR